MNRRGFFKFLGIGAAAAVVAPKVLATEPSRLDNITKMQIALKKMQLKRQLTGEPLRWSEMSARLDVQLATFEEPLAGYDYSIGVEAGDGLGGSPSCISVMRIGKGEEPCIQVAEFVSTQHNPAQLVPVIAQIARKYGEKCIDPRGPLLVIEQVSAPGDCTQWQLKIMGFTRFYKAMSAKGIKRDGWYTTKTSRPILVDRFTEAIKNGWYKPLFLLHGEISDDPRFMAAAQSYLASNRGI